MVAATPVVAFPAAGSAVVGADVVGFAVVAFPAAGSAVVGDAVLANANVVESTGAV